MHLSWVLVMSLWRGAVAMSTCVGVKNVEVGCGVLIELINVTIGEMTESVHTLSFIVHKSDVGDLNISGDRNRYAKSSRGYLKRKEHSRLYTVKSTFY
ncbi:hypothetical protein BDF14DRAFT_1841615 [Spinellus fusiger]|nr:hypothetical protein BDF14DRAFT_1841615 [Spinellus fusiger]